MYSIVDFTTIKTNIIHLFLINKPLPPKCKQGSLLCCCCRVRGWDELAQEIKWVFVSSLTKSRRSYAKLTRIWFRQTHVSGSRPLETRLRALWKGSTDANTHIHIHARHVTAIKMHKDTTPEIMLMSSPVCPQAWVTEYDVNKCKMFCSCKFKSTFSHGWIISTAGSRSGYFQKNSAFQTFTEQAPVSCFPYTDYYDEVITLYLRTPHGNLRKSLLINCLSFKHLHWENVAASRLMFLKENILAQTTNRTK